MKRYILILVTLLTFGLAQSQTPGGVSIESDGIPFIVLLDGKQISIPTQSCFIANLGNGDHLIEAYAINGTRRRELLLSERIHYRGKLIRLKVENHFPPQSRPDFTPVPAMPVYNPEQFTRFLKVLKDESFDDNRLTLIKTNRGTVWYTCDQVARMCKVFDFDSGQLKMLEIVIPYTVDLQNWFVIAEKLDFDSSKKKLQKLVQKETDH